MPVEFDLSEAAHERGTYPIDVSFVDEDGAPAIPKAGLKWSLTKEDMTTIVNSRKDVVVSVPASTITILLKGADLAMDTGKVISWRYLIVEGTYDSTLGSDLPINDHVKFPIENIAKVPG